MKKKSLISKTRSFYNDKALARILSLKSLFYFNFHLVYLRFSFNFSILVSVVEYLEIFMFLISIFDLQPYCVICFHCVISMISLVYLLRHFLPVFIPTSISPVYSENMIFYSSGSSCAHICEFFSSSTFLFAFMTPIVFNNLNNVIFLNIHIF